MSMLSCLQGVKAEKAYKENKTLPDPSSTEDPEFKIVLKLLKNTLAIDPQKSVQHQPSDLLRFLASYLCV